MLMPKRVKHRKCQKGRMRGLSYRGNEVSFGDFALQATGCGRMTARQIEAARVALTRYIKRQGQVWIRVFPDKPISKKPAETRMGKGKPGPDHWVAIIKPGRVLYEVEGVSIEAAKEAFRLAGHKLPFSTKFIKRREVLR